MNIQAVPKKAIIGLAGFLSWTTISTPTVAFAQMNPYQLGMQYCQMVNNGISREKAWKYTIDSYMNSNPYGLNSGDPYAPWSPTRTLGGAIGSGLASGLIMGSQLKAMKGEIDQVINTNCPFSYSPFSATVRQESSVDPLSNDWLHQQCKDATDYKGCIEVMSVKQKAAIKEKEQAAAKLKKEKELIEMEPWERHLQLNPRLKEWAKTNPIAAEKIKRDFLTKLKKNNQETSVPSPNPDSDSKFSNTKLEYEGFIYKPRY
jgi:hypothetical protein